jgi:Domain of unknown function (DUF5658)
MPPLGRDRHQPATFRATLRCSTVCPESRRHTISAVDRLSPLAVWLVLFVVICSAIDALFTLLYLQQGGSEANPVMALALNKGVTMFVSLKMGLTGLGTSLLAIHENSWLGRKSLQALALTYSMLLLYHFLLFYKCA